MARLMLALFVIASMIALFCSGTFGKVSTDTLAVLKPNHITYSIIVKYMRKLRIRYMDSQQLDIPFHSIFIVIIICVIKINILKVAWRGKVG